MLYDLMQEKSKLSQEVSFEDGKRRRAIFLAPSVSAASASEVVILSYSSVVKVFSLNCIFNSFLAFRLGLFVEFSNKPYLYFYQFFYVISNI